MTDEDGNARDPELQQIYDRLNRQFYTAEPHLYFRQRWSALKLSRDESDGGAECNPADQQSEKPQIGGSSANQLAQRHYVAIEAEVLLHQTMETLLRFFLAHWDTDGCPWLDIAAERAPAQFKTRVETELVNAARSALQEAVHEVCLAGVSRPGQLAESDWQRALENLAAFIRPFASRWLRDAPLYNSLKHGLSAVPGSVQVAVASEPDLSDARNLGRGLSVDYLDFDKVIPKRRVWRQVTKWLDVGESLELTRVAFEMIESIWDLGRARYTDSPVPRRLFLPVDITPLSFRSPDRAAMTMVAFSLNIEDSL